ncbi:excinuclease ABC subunit C [Kordia sp. TARA_039_SRF]|nr:excinuclease ABC subunit C [Kordia sp. TARA_039_SRF]
MLKSNQKFYCYILSNKNRSVLYIGYTNNLKRRLNEHKKGTATLFTKKYSVCDLIYFEVFDDMKLAKRREKQLKNWHKDWKWNLVKSKNELLKTLQIK